MLVANIVRKVDMRCAIDILAYNSGIITITKITCFFVKKEKFSYNIYHFTSPKITRPAALS